MGNGSSVSSDESYRVIEVDPDNDPITTPYSKNKISTNKYTVFTFVPQNLFEQFRRIGNFYFLVSAIVSTLSNSPISPWTSWLPLSFVILVTAVKQGYEDFIRYKSDKTVNNRLVTVIRNKVVQKICSEQIVVGDLVRVNRDEDVPCDLIILHSSDPSGKCYVTTSNLDGETNLKTMLVPRIFVELEMSQIVSMRAVVTCILPVPGLYIFEGKVKATIPPQIGSLSETVTRSGPLGIENAALRGSRLKDTDFIIGCAVYTGCDTKLSLNSHAADPKFSIAEKSVNRYILVFLVFLAIEVLFCFILKLVNSPGQFNIYLGKQKPPVVKFLGSLLRHLNDLLGFIILFNFVIPISLYVTIEMQSFLGSFFIGWDREIYDEDTDQPAMANTSDLNEDLGQIQYLFTDKTGTLTENIMIFKRCYVDGDAYVERDCDGTLRLLQADGAEESAEQVELWTPELWHFMIAIALCHEVHIAPPSQKAKAELLRTEYRESFRLKKTMAANSSLMMDPKLPEYEAASIDEKALVEAAARCGVIFLGDNNSDAIEIDAKGTRLNYTRLEILEFSSDRKRMSVIIEDSNGDIWLYCKGADSSVFSLMERSETDEAKDYVNDFSKRGLRTLVMGYKKFTREEYDTLMREVNYARQTMGPDRATNVARVYETVEKGLTLLGVTAVEDRLQDGVPETMEKLRAAGIKVWVLTGDKAETAENIAYFCGHFKQGTELLRLTDVYADQLIFITLIYFERRMMLEPDAQYGLLIDGSSLTVALHNCPMLLSKIAMACEAVVCCRMSPLQKSEMVQLVKQHPIRPLTAAIGDGGNDVSMIKEAHVGLGITGKEGRQAAMSADFAFAKFRFLERLILVHGHWYYLRISVLIQYFFYKNLILTLPQLCFTIFSAFSTTPLYDSLLLMSFNLFFTSGPIIIYGITTQNYSAETLLEKPQLYQLYKKNYLLRYPTFFKWTFIAVWQAMTIFFIPYFCLVTDFASLDMWKFSMVIFHLVVLIPNLELLIISSHWNFPFLMCIIMTLVFFLGFNLIYSFWDWNYDGDLYMVYPHLLCSPTFWLVTVLVVAICIIPPLLLGVWETGSPERLQGRIDMPREMINEATDSRAQRASVISFYPPESRYESAISSFSWMTSDYDVSRSHNSFSSQSRTTRSVYMRSQSTLSSRSNII